MKRVAAMVVLAVLLLAGCAGELMTWQEQYDLGMRYLNESNYEEAILAFTQAIEIDPKNVEGYLGRAEAYLGAGGEENRALAVADYLTAADLCVEQGNPERAEEILNNAQEAVGEDSEISNKLYEITGKRPDTKLENKYFKDGSLKVEYEYDERELLIKETYYNTDGSLSYYLKYEYNENNSLIKLESYDSAGNLEMYYTYEYDESGNLAKRSFYIPAMEQYELGSLSSYTTYEYDQNGQLTKASEHNANGTLALVTEYGEDGNRMKTDYYVDNSVSEYSTYEYDENGNEAKRSDYYADGSLKWYYVYEYDENGNQIKGSRYDQNNSMMDYWTNEYDELGNQVRMNNYDKDGNLEYTTEYDETGNVIN